jgi:GNAT superfamily N-acetyltransferase
LGSGAGGGECGAGEAVGDFELESFFVAQMNIRLGNKGDLPFLQQMLFEAFFWNPDTPRPTMNEFFANPDFQMLLSNWGRAGDKAVVAEEKNTSVGAAWYRFWTRSHHSYGFVAPEIPEIGMAVCSTQRSRGIGRALLRALIGEARNDGIPAVGLSVAPLNLARYLYESEGFVKVGESGTSWTMMIHL